MQLIKGTALEKLVGESVRGALKPGYTELDIRLGKKAWVEKERSHAQRIHVMKPHNWSNHLKEVTIPDHGITLNAWGFMLAETLETFDLPLGVQGLLTLRSWAAKSGLEQSSSLILKAGWSGVLIMELFNSLSTYDLLMEPSAPIAQIQFFDISEDEDDGK